MRREDVIVRRDADVFDDLVVAVGCVAVIINRVFLVTAWDVDPMIWDVFIMNGQFLPIHHVVVQVNGQFLSVHDVNVPMNGQFLSVHGVIVLMNGQLLPIHHVAVAVNGQFLPIHDVVVPIGDQFLLIRAVLEATLRVDGLPARGYEVSRRFKLPPRDHEIA